MKVVVMVLLIICTGAKSYCQPHKEQAAAGIGMTSAVFRNTLRIEVAYAFSEHWSLEGDAWKRFPSKDRKSTEEKIHDILLGHTEEVTVGEDADGLCATVCYWPSKAFSGPFLAIGYAYEERGRNDGCIGIGYMMKVWKGLAIRLSLKSGISELAAGTEMKTCHLDISINYIF